MPEASRNRLIESLPGPQRERLLGLCSPVELVLGAVLCEPDQPVDHVYFPLTGFISLVTRLGERPPLEVGLIGNEGMLGSELSLGVLAAPAQGVVQGAGTALRLSARALSREMRASPALLRVLLRYQYVLLAQVLQSTACARFHAIEPRLVRWLLMTHDRAESDQFHLTHEFLANMLGVQRGGITIAAGALQARRLIRYARGRITVLDRAGLEATSCECYGALINAYEMRFGGNV